MGAASPSNRTDQPVGACNVAVAAARQRLDTHRVESSKRFAAVTVALALFLGSRATIALIPRHGISDTPVYSLYAFVIRKASRLGQSPYDLYERVAHSAHGEPRLRFDQVTIEYPPLALALMLAPQAGLPDDAGLGAHGKATLDVAKWARSFRWLYFAADAATVIGFLLWSQRRGLGSPWGLAIGTVGGIALASLLYDRLDLWVGMVLLGALGAQVAGRKYVALALLAVAVNLKLVPLLLLPLFLLGALPSTVLVEGLAKWRALRAGLLACGVFASVALGLFLPFRLAWGPRVWDFLAYHSQRGLQIESTWSSILLVAARLGCPVQVVHAFGAGGIAGTAAGFLATASVGAVLAATFLIYWLIWHAARRSRAAAATRDNRFDLSAAESNPQAFIWASFAVLAVAIAGSKVFSPQYLCWFLPGYLLVEQPHSRRGAAAPLAFLLACGLTAVIFPGLWAELMRPTSSPNATYLLPTLRVTLLVLGRNLVWIGFCVLAVLHMQRSWWQSCLAKEADPSLKTKSPIPV
jgi:hypothetical protein